MYVMYAMQCLVGSIYVRVSAITAIQMVGRIFISTPTNRHRFPALSLPWRSPLQVLAGLDVNFSDRVTEQALVAMHRGSLRRKKER